MTHSDPHPTPEDAAEAGRVALIEAQVILSRLPFFAELCERYELTLGEFFTEVDPDTAECIVMLNSRGELWLESKAQQAYAWKHVRPLLED